ncbi:MAG: hypothetical protein ACSHXB_13040 [Sulfitobacter sp.]
MIRSAFYLCTALGFASAVSAEGNLPTCDPTKNFYILGSIVGAGEGLCRSHDPNRGATLSFQRNHITDTSDGEIHATAAWRVVPPGVTNNGLSYTSFLFASADGHFDGADGPNETRLGFYTEAFYHGPAVGPRADLFLSYGIAGFLLSDFDFGASGYGVKASIIPIVNSDTFGVNYVGEAGTPYLIARADLDMLWVNEGGETGYADDTEYGFLEAKLGVGYSLKNKIDASLTFTQGTDLIGGNSYGGASANVSFPLAGSDNLKLTVNYNRAEDRATGNKTETSKMLLQFRF